MDTIAVCNQKGGVGKTSITINLGAALTEDHRKVLVVDLDPQGHLTTALGMPEADDETEPTLTKAMLGKWRGHPAELVRAYSDRLHVIPTSMEAFTLPGSLYQEFGRDHRLARVLEPLEGQYNAVLIDCPPSLGPVTDNALVAAGRVLIPVQAEDSSLRALRLLLRQIEGIQDALRIHIDLVGMVVNQFDKRRGSIVTSTLDALQHMPLPVLGVLGDRAAIRETWRWHRPVVEHSPQSEAASQFRDLAKAIRWAQ